MPLIMADIGKEYEVADVKGNDKTKHHLQTLGFTQGAKVIVVSRLDGNFIVNVRETRIAINAQMASKVILR